MTKNKLFVDLVFGYPNNRIEKLLPFLTLLTSLVATPFSSINKSIPATTTTTTTTAKESVGYKPCHAFVVIPA